MFEVEEPPHDHCLAALSVLLVRAIPLPWLVPSTMYCLSLVNIAVMYFPAHEVISGRLSLLYAAGFQCRVVSLDLGLFK